MTEVTRTDGPGTTAGSLPGSLTRQGVAAEPDLIRSALIGYAVGFLVATISITIAGTLGGLGLGSSFGLGAFVGFWGGGGFGFMLGGTIPLSHAFDDQRPPAG